MRGFVVILAGSLGLAGCATGEGSLLAALGHTEPASHEECMARANAPRAYYNTAGALGAAIIRVGDVFGRAYQRHRCDKQFSVKRVRVDGIELVVRDKEALEKAEKEDAAAKPRNPGVRLEVPVKTPFERYEQSKVRGQAHAIVSDFDYGEFNCRMSGALQSVC